MKSSFDFLLLARRSFMLWLTLFCFFFNQSVSGQIGYVYDSAGNRVSCYILKVSSQADIINDEMIVEHDVGSREIKLYPNPTKGLLFLNVANGEDDEKYSLTLFSLSGQKLLEQRHAGNGAFSINVEGFPSGTYILRLKTNDAQIHYKIIKQ